ncbi:MAG: DNA polymerase, partial [Candidatus Thorarchaeota archaeon]
AKGYKVLKKTKGGKSGIRKRALDKDIIEIYSDKYSDDKVLQLRAQYKSLLTAYNLYVKGFKKRMTHNGYLHTRYNQAVVTGRLSSADPNLQNVKRVGKEDPYTIRKMFIVEAGMLMLVWDYEQLESRILADMSGEQGMIDIFHRGWDIHSGNASMVFDLPYEDITKAKKLTDDEWERLPKEEYDYYQKCKKARQDAKDIGFGQLDVRPN